MRFFLNSETTLPTETGDWTGRLQTDRTAYSSAGLIAHVTYVREGI